MLFSLAYHISDFISKYKTESEYATIYAEEVEPDSLGIRFEFAVVEHRETGIYRIMISLRDRCFLSLPTYDSPDEIYLVSHQEIRRAVIQLLLDWWGETAGAVIK